MKTKIRGRIKANGSLSANIFCVSCCDPFIEKKGRLEYVDGGCHDIVQGYKNMQKKAKQLKIISFFLFLLSSSLPYTLSFSWPGSFQPGTPKSSLTNANVFNFFIN
jgi:hypothetical protein